jgi:hypothetical protein
MIPRLDVTKVKEVLTQRTPRAQRELLLAFFAVLASFA